jgi:hypothetical protein
MEVVHSSLDLSPISFAPVRGQALPQRGQRWTRVEALPLLRVRGSARMAAVAGSCTPQ